MSIPPDQVTATFDEVAAGYDRQVDLNPGYHANLRRAADALVSRLPSATPDRLLDVGCGSGASTKALALALLRRGRPATVVGVDGSAGMLAAARAKRWPPEVSFMHAQADEISDHVPDPVDGILAAYLVRNVADPSAVIADLTGLLKPGGVLAIHEYSVRGNPAAAALWTLVCWLVVVPLGWVTVRHTRLYRYLWRSVLRFDSIPQLTARLRAAGLVDVEVVRATGWHRGILHTVIARRPAVSA